MKASGDKIGILTGGGDVPGLNPVIKSVVYGMRTGSQELSAFARAGRASPTCPARMTQTTSSS